MSELREDLARALRAVDAGPAPVARAIRRGRAMRFRRRAALAAGALAVVAGAVGYPALARHAAAPAPVPVQHPHDPVITDVPALRPAAAGLVASGKIGGVPWHVFLRAGGTPTGTCLTGDFAAPGSARVTLTLPCGIVLAGDVPDPAGFDGTAGSGLQVQLGKVAPNVAYLVLSFTDGQWLKLIPVTRYGHRFVAFAAPLGMPVKSVTAHLGGPHFDSGVTRTAIPLSRPGQLPYIGTWLRPGQPLPPRVTRLVASGTVGGTPWSVTAYQGPWGTCLVYLGGASACMPTTELTSTALQGSGLAPHVYHGSAARDVAYLRITMPDGTALPEVTPVAVGPVRLWAAAASDGRTPRRWTAYSASGAPLSSGTFPG